MDEDRKFYWKVAGGITLGLFFVILLGMWGCPQYSVWQQELHGKAELARATYNRQIAVQEAEAKMHAAELLGQAEAARARGVAEANKIIGDSLRNNEPYLRYLWIHTLGESKDHQVIYVPTEAGLPILEAGRHR